MIVIVSGLPRSGTSLMMQMLKAGGASLLIDEQRPADADNPNGYWEYTPVKRLSQDNSWMHQAEGKAVKVISALLQYLPPQHTYKIIFMQRPMQEVLASQAVMLERQGAQGDKADDQTLGTVFSAASRPYRALVGDAETHDGSARELSRNDCQSCRDSGPCSAISRSATCGDAMARAVDPRLHRQGDEKCPWPWIVLEKLWRRHKYV